LREMVAIRSQLTFYEVNRPSLTTPAVSRVFLSF
jgi:hypothetical protein